MENQEYQKYEEQKDIKETVAEEKADGNPFKTPANQQYYVNMVTHVLLLIFTFGIWYLIWIYKASQFMHDDDEDPGFSPVAHLLLCMFIPYYQIYWYYKLCEKLDKYYGKAGMAYDRTLNTAFCIILVVLAGGIFAAILAQDSINRLVGDIEPKTVTCKNCGKEFMDNHATCPHCGAEYRVPLYKKAWFWILVVLLGLGVCGIGVCSVFSVSDAVRQEMESYADSYYYYEDEDGDTQDYYEDLFDDYYAPNEGIEQNAV